ncbi:MAG: PfkB family carbohydrate kinase [Cyanobacteria bacterium P01_A01_bin.114]
MKRGLFVGLVTLDYIYQADHPPAANEKVVATQAMMAAGGPTTNAAVAFSQLADQRAIVLGVLGAHPLAALIREDLARWQVDLIDLQPERAIPPPVSSIVVSAATGERAVISRNAADRQHLSDAPFDTQYGAQWSDLLDGVDVILIDGHQMAMGATLAALAQARDIPVVVDAGSWKPGFDRVLRRADVVIASANFSPPDRSDPMTYLGSLGIAKIAITQGEQPIQVSQQGRHTQLEVPQVKVVDTLGAGDIFHGAFCHFYPELPFESALAAASRVAAFACQHFGTRDWINPYSASLPI